VAVVGSRPPKWDAPDEAQEAYVARKQAVRAFVRDLPADIILVSGGARGVDTIAERAAICRRPIESYRPERQGDGTWRVRLIVFDARGNVVSQELLPPVFPRFVAAAFWRNYEMVRVANRVAAFHDGTSRGTAYTMRKARAAGKLIP
jgi:hypothetical protein